MSDKIEVYRESSAPHEPKPDGTYGLLNISPAAQHMCSPPGLLVRILLRLVGRLKWRTLWRCHRCGGVWQWLMRQDDEGDREYEILRKWVKVDISVWTEAGGKL